MATAAFMLVVFVAASLLNFDNSGVCQAKLVVDTSEAVAASAENIQPEEQSVSKKNEIVIENGAVCFPINRGSDRSVGAAITFCKTLPEFAEVSISLVQPKGAPSMVVLTAANNEDLIKAARKVKTLLAQAGDPHLIIISAYLREIDVTDIVNAGVDWSQLIGSLSFSLSTVSRAVTPAAFQLNPETNQWIMTSAAQIKDTIIGGLTTSNSPAGSWSVTAQLNQAMAASRCIIGSNVYTPNGISAEMLSQLIVPIQTTDSNGNAVLTNQTISSNLRVTPVVVEINKEKPNESVIKMDIYMKMAMLTGKVAVGNSEADEFVTKSLSTIAYVKADNSDHICGVFASDMATKYDNGVPILMNIPLLKYLFKTTGTSTAHKVGVLLLSARLIPSDVWMSPNNGDGLFN